MAQYRYNTFGKLMNESGSFEQSFGFSTKRYDKELGLCYYEYRFYVPGMERWLNRDPLGETGGINLYGFVENDPVNRVDPFWGKITNNHPTTTYYVKPEHGTTAVPVKPNGGTFDGPVDSITAPNGSGGQDVCN